MAKTIKKNSLSQNRIVRVAVKYADKKGIESLNMRKLASLLNTGAMSIYHYFANKEELLDAMVEWVAAKISLPAPTTPWRTAIKEISISAHHVLSKHVWVNNIWSKQKLGPNKLMYMESILRSLREGGFSVSLACDAYHAVIVHIEGFTLHAVGFPVKPSNVQSAASMFLNTIEDPELIPYFIEHVQHHIEQRGCNDQFEMILDMLLDGFETRFKNSL